MKIKDLLEFLFAWTIMGGIGYMFYLNWRVALTATSIVFGVLTIIALIQEAIPYWKKLMNVKIY